MVKPIKRIMENKQEILYFLFFGIMIFSKGIGLDSGDRLYYVLSVLAFGFVFLKIVLTKYNKWQIAVILLLCLIAFAAYRNSGRLGIILTVLTVIGMKDICIPKLFRMGAVVYGVSFCTTIVLAAAGVIANPLVVHEKGGIEVIRWGMGYSTGNIFHVSYFILVVLCCYTWGKKHLIRQTLLLMAGNVLVYLFSLSYTGAIVTTVYLLLNLYAVKRKRIAKAEGILCLLPLPFCLLFSFGAPLLLGQPLIDQLDHMLQARLTFSAYYLQNQPITLLGTRMKDIPNFWVIMDNGFVYILMTFGIVIFILFSVGYMLIIIRFIRQQRLQELAMAFSFLLYGMMEQFISNSFMNLSLIFLGELLFVRCCEKTGSEAVITNAKSGLWKDLCGKISRKKTAVMLTGGITAAASLLLYLLIADVPASVPIPPDSLNYIDSHSMIVHVPNQKDSKEELLDKKKSYQFIMEDDSLIAEALDQMGSSFTMSTQEVREALEFAVPMYVQKSGVYNDFRVRLLHLYPQYTEEEYGQLLQSLSQAVTKRVDTSIYQQDAVYREQIGKSFGEDRIEHISSDKIYDVNKSGTIVKIEYGRRAIMALLAGLAAGILVSSGIYVARAKC